MRDETSFTFFGSSKEELLAGMESDFPCVTSRAFLDRYPQPAVPWHWHRAFELFYLESGVLDYYTPRGTVSLYAGCGGLVNSNVLHRTTHRRGSVPTIQLLHLFEPAFLAGAPGSRIEKRYIQPVLSAPQLELLPVFPDTPEKFQLLQALRATFRAAPEAPGYELRLRSALSDIWLRLLELAEPYLRQSPEQARPSDQVKRMLVYLYEHYGEPISVQTLSEIAFCSQRACYRAFRKHHLTRAHREKKQKSATNLTQNTAYRDNRRCFCMRRKNPEPWPLV